MSNIQVIKHNTLSSKKLTVTNTLHLLKVGAVYINAKQIGSLSVRLNADSVDRIWI